MVSGGTVGVSKGARTCKGLSPEIELLREVYDVIYQFGELMKMCNDGL